MGDKFLKGDTFGGFVNILEGIENDTNSLVSLSKADKPQFDGLGFKKNNGSYIKNGFKYTSFEIFGRKNAIYTTKTTCAPYPASFPSASTFNIHLTGAATKVKIASNDARDTFPAGDGARAVVIIGYDASYNEIVEVILLNGTTAVTSVNSFFRIIVMNVQQTGQINNIQSGPNYGTISMIPESNTFTAGVPTTLNTTMCIMSPGSGIGDIGYSSTPPGAQVYFTKFSISTSTIKKDAVFDIELLGRHAGELTGWRSFVKLTTSSDVPVANVEQSGFPNIDTSGGLDGNDFQIVVKRNVVSGSTDTDFSVFVFMTGYIVEAV